VFIPGWKEIKRPKILHKRSKWTKNDNLIEMDGVATHYCE
jgi:hypothetical protein